MVGKLCCEALDSGDIKGLIRICRALINVKKYPRKLVVVGIKVSVSDVKTLLKKRSLISVLSCDHIGSVSLEYSMVLVKESPAGSRTSMMSGNWSIRNI